VSVGRGVDILIVGAGLAGIATAYYLSRKHRRRSILLVDARPPMSFTSAQSGDNYRNWWPHPTMTAFTNHSIELMQAIASETSNVIEMTRRGYLLATRLEVVDNLVESLHTGYGDSPADAIRLHQGASSASSYIPPDSDGWVTAPSGVDVLCGRRLISRWFPALSEQVVNLVHVRRAGDISGYQLGRFMLEVFRDAGGSRLMASVRAVEANGGYRVDVEGNSGAEVIEADVLVNAAGPFTAEIAAMLGIALPVENIYQQKILFEDVLDAVPRDLPFSIDLDPVRLGWTEEERTLLSEDPDTVWLIGQLSGGAHCRPDGGSTSRWVKLGWAFNRNVSTPLQEPANDPGVLTEFPEIVMRAVSNLVPALRPYAGRMPSRFSHYGGYYTSTPENWPLIGPLGVDGAFIVGALSGFGTMSACAAGALCADWIAGAELPGYARQLSPARYDDEAFVAELAAAPSKGVL